MSFAKFCSLLKRNKKCSLQMEETTLHTPEEESPPPCVELQMEQRLLTPLENRNQNGVVIGPKNRTMRIICSPYDTSADEKTTRLLKAIQLQRIADVCSILEKYSSQQINQIFFSGQNLLHYSTLKKDLDILTVVLSKNADPNLFNVDGLTPLHLAILESWDEGIECLLQNGASIDLHPEPTCHTFGVKVEAPILMALRIGHFPTIFTLLEKSPDLNVKDDKNNSVLHLAASTHCYPVLDQLLDTGGQILNEIFSQNDDGDTPLHCLFMDKNLPEKEDDIIECIKLLLHSGSEIDAQNNFERTPLFTACRKGLSKAAEALLNAGADPTIKTKDGRTVLHAACRAGSADTLSLLLETGRTNQFVNVEDNKGRAPFHAAANGYSLDCCEVLLVNGDHLTQKDSQNQSRCSVALRNMPNAKHLFQKVFDKHITREKDLEDKDFSVSFDFSVLLRNPEDDVDDSLISEIYDSEVENLLKHPLVESFIFLKWQRLRFFFFSYALIYISFLSLHTFFIIKTYGMKTDWSKEQSTIMTVRLLLIILLVLLIIPGTITLMANFSKFLKQFETYFKMVALISAVFVVFSQESMSTNPELERNIAAISIFFTWVEFMMLLGRFPALGIYIFMFTRVAKSLIKFLMAFSSLLIAFSLSLTILLNKISVFNTFSIGFVKTLMMMIGEIDYGDLYEGIKEEGTLTIVIGHIFLIVFLFMVPILMANLLIGLAVNDLPDLQTHGKIRRLVKEAAYIISYERICFVFKNVCRLPTLPREKILRRLRSPRVVTIYPNKCPSKFKGLWKLPQDIMDEAIALTEDGAGQTISMDSNRLEDLRYAFYHLCKDFEEDKKKTEKRLEEIFKIVSAGNEDAVDSAKKRSKRIFSRKYHRINQSTR